MLSVYFSPSNGNGRGFVDEEDWGICALLRDVISEGKKIKRGTVVYFDNVDWEPYNEEFYNNYFGRDSDEKEEIDTEFSESFGGNFAVIYLEPNMMSEFYTVPLTALRPATMKEAERFLEK